MTSPLLNLTNRSISSDSTSGMGASVETVSTATQTERVSAPIEIFFKHEQKTETGISFPATTTFDGT